MGKDVARHLETVMACSGAGCPGVRDRKVVNNWQTGTPPRGLTIRPWASSLADVELVVIGQNPGNADPFERAVNADHALAEHRAELLGRWLTAAMPYITYWVEVDRLLDALFQGGSAKTVLAVEGYYCQHGSSEPAPDDVRQIFDHCSERHLAHQLSAVKEQAASPPIVVGLGRHVREWWRSSTWRTEFRFVAAQHPSGNNPRWRDLFAPDDPTVLAPFVAQAWRRFESSEEQSVDLWHSRNGSFIP